MLRNAIAWMVVLTAAAAPVTTEAGLNLFFWKKEEPPRDRYCAPQCSAPPNYYCGGPSQNGCYCPPQNGGYCYYPAAPREKKKCSCFKGEHPEFAPLVTSVAAAFLNQPAVRVTQDPEGPGIRLRVEAEPEEDESEDGSGLQADRLTNSLDQRVSDLEKDLTETTVLLNEISRQLKEIQ